MLRFTAGGRVRSRFAQVGELASRWSGGAQNARADKKVPMPAQTMAKPVAEARYGQTKMIRLSI